MQHNVLAYGNEMEDLISKIAACLHRDYGISKRAMALLLLQQDEEIRSLVEKEENIAQIRELIHQGNAGKEPLIHISKIQQVKSRAILHEVFTVEQRRNSKIGSVLNRITLNPLTGIPLLILVLYFGLYQFVGVFGAGTLVNWIEKGLFDLYINPFVNRLAEEVIPWGILRDLVANDYGVLTLGIKYAVAIVLPVVGCFFLVFSIIEDSGYLPRISLLMDRVFKVIGLNGRAVIPMTLGFGCDTMATMVSRTLETKRERIIATLLLALAIPCSAQLGVILALLSVKPESLLLWVVFMLLVFVLIGYLAAKVLPGTKPDFYMEIPPLRLPRPVNVLKKTYVRMYWYLKEVLPLFVLASVLIWLGNLTGLFSLALDLLKPVMGLLGLPDESARVFLFGFFRRDYGAAGLFDMQGSGLLNARQMVVTSVTLTLFVPCIAQFTMMIKERGIKTALGIAAFILPFAFGMGYLVNQLLILLKFA